MKERLQKVIARAGVASRRAAERLIVDGRVQVNGTVVRELGTQVDPTLDTVRVDDRRLANPPTDHVYMMLNKPRGFMTTLSDPEGRPTVRDLLRGLGSRRVFPVGRLDFNSEGLLLLTDDGELARDLMDPHRGVPKTYRVKVRGRPVPAALRRLARGIPLDGRPTKPAKVRITEDAANAWLEVTVVEGRNHHVRRMLEAVGHPVVKLRRQAYAGLQLGRLAAGEARRLTATEVARLRRSAGRVAKARARN